MQENARLQEELASLRAERWKQQWKRNAHVHTWGPDKAKEIYEECVEYAQALVTHHKDAFLNVKKGRREYTFTIWDAQVRAKPPTPS